MSAPQVSALASTVSESLRDPYRFPGSRDFDQYDAGEAGDYLLPAPDPKRRLPYLLAAADRRRLDLHAALTVAGIAPRPGDAGAIEVLCTLDDVTVLTLLRWISSPG
jgi:hypothetical protein